MDYRSRSGRLSSEQKSGSGRTIVFLIVSFAMIAFIVFTTVGKSCASGVVEAIFGNNKEEENEKITDALSNQEENLPSPSPKQQVSTVNAQLPAKTFYILQMGQYTDNAAAIVQANTIKSMGAGGYVYSDGELYRVFAAAYPDEDSLKKVQDQVRSAGYDNSAYVLSVDELIVKISGEEETAEAVAKALNLNLDLIEAIYDCSISFDKSEISFSDVMAQMQEWHLELYNSASELQADEDNAQMTYVINYMKDTQNSLSTFLLIDDTISTVELSAEIKKLHIQTIVRYMDFVEEAESVGENETS